MKSKTWRLWTVAAVVAAAAAGLMHDYSRNDARIVRQVTTDHKVVSFTFDDGPHPGTTPELLALLREKGVKATFFILGANAEEHKSLLKQVIADGHELGNHGYSHRFLRETSLEKYLSEVDRNEAILTAAGVKPVLFRPPGGSYDDTLVARLRDKGYTTVLWSVDTRDWSRPAVTQVVQTAAGSLKPGRIFLFHDGQPALPTVQAVKLLIDNFQAQGYAIVPVGELLQYEELRQ